jgi:hypothetical protein
VLIAAAIAAGTIAATALMLGGSARLSRETAARFDTLLAAQTISARLESGMDDDEALAGYDGWLIARAAFPRGQANAEPYFDRVSLERTDGTPFKLEILVRRPNGGAE